MKTNLLPLVLLVAAGFVAHNVSAYDFSESYAGATFYYNILSEEDKTCEVTSGTPRPDWVSFYDDYTDYVGDVVIPTSANGYTVVRIDEMAFSLCKDLKSVMISNSVTHIGQNAFYGCTGLKKVTFGNSVVDIPYRAFADCYALTEVMIPKSVTNVGPNPFIDCYNLTRIVVEDGNTKYHSENNCNAVIDKTYNRLVVGCKNTVIPDGVKTIGQYSFYGCSGLTSIKIPSSVKSIDFSAFYGCKGLTEFVIPNTVTNIGESAFWGCSGLTELVIPNSVKTIGSGAFRGCTGLTKMTIPSSITSLERSVFESCTGLTEVTIPNSVTSIGDFAFNSCSNLLSVTIPTSVTKIGQCAFQHCSSLTEVTIPVSVNRIGGNAFYGCSGLTSITSFIRDVFETGSNAFGKCENATLYVPEGLKETYQSASDWSSLTKIEEFNERIPLAMACNDMGRVVINREINFTNKMADVSIFYGIDNYFSFAPYENCELGQVLLDGLDITKSVKENQLKAIIRKNSHMMVIFVPKGADVNRDGSVDISDVVALVNIILGQ